MTTELIKDLRRRIDGYGDRRSFCVQLDRARERIAELTKVEKALEGQPTDALEDEMLEELRELRACLRKDPST